MIGRVAVADLDAACDALVERIAAERARMRDTIPAGVGSGTPGRTGTDAGTDAGSGTGAVPRLLIAIAGPPAGGKSTLASALVERLEDAVLVPMDGFHLDDALLGPAGLLPRKGSPPTFDVDGLSTLLERIARDDGRAVHVPVFERERELSRAAAATVAPGHRTIVVEGNYLLLDEAPWNALSGRFDLRVMLEVDESTLRERLVRRWTAGGLTPAAALARAEANDLPNGRRVVTESVAADVVLVVAVR